MKRINRDSAINFALRAPDVLRMKMRLHLWRALGVRVGAGCLVQAVQLPRNPWDIELGAKVMLEREVVLMTTGGRCAAPRIVLGEGVYINRFCMLDAIERIEIGADSMLGPHCYITDHDHGTQHGVAMNAQEYVSAPVLIGANVWIGAGALILKGVTIGDGAIVGAGSVVTRDVAPHARVVGVPARALTPTPLPTPSRFLGG